MLNITEDTLGVSGTFGEYISVIFGCQQMSSFSSIASKMEALTREFEIWHYKYSDAIDSIIDFEFYENMYSYSQEEILQKYLVVSENLNELYNNGKLTIYTDLFGYATKDRSKKPKYELSTTDREVILEKLNEVEQLFR